MSDYKITYDGVDLSPCCDRGVTDYVYEIQPHDYLGDPTPEQADEVKASRQNFNIALVVATFIATALVMLAVGIFIGAVKPQIWNHVPFVAGDCDAIVQPCRVVRPVSEPSGERAEPEEGAR